MRLGRKPRRGVLLLVVLSVLVLFVLSCLAFIIVAGNYRRGAFAHSRLELTADKPSKLLDRAMYQVLRDTTNTQSSLWRHSLLSDLYGNDGFVGHVVRASRNPETDGQLIQIAFGVEYGLSQAAANRPAEYYNGSVITMVSGPARGLSARIVQSGDVNTAPGRFGWLFAEDFTSDDGQLVQPNPNDRFVVNGVPFNGTGFGYNPATGRLDLPARGHNSKTLAWDVPITRVALAPNFTSVQTSTAVDSGGADEGYDVPNFQNMFLAKVPPAATSSEDIIPSFHQPALIRYWIGSRGGNSPPGVLRDVARPFVLRPTQLDHPNFTGSNPAFAINGNDTTTFLRTLLSGPWDVDNDGDGITDSVWLDLGLRTCTASDGQLYRPLFAILCTDLDNRLNLNVHGTREQLVLQTEGDEINWAFDNDVVAGTPSPWRPPRGLGYGPPEVNLAVVLGTDDFTRLLDGRYADCFGREKPPVPGGRPNVDLLSLLNFDLPENYDKLTRPSLPQYLPDLGVYGSPGDISGNGVVVVDHTGQPLFLGPARDLLNNIATQREKRGAGRKDAQTTTNPYDLNVIEPDSWDSLYAVAELETLLRRNDVDTPILPRRLLDVARDALSGSNFHTISQLLTTHSFHVPVATIQLPANLRGGVNPSTTILDWMSRRLKANGVANIPRQLRRMVPFEIRHGQKMDINRPWADSLDDFGRGDPNGNGYMDAEQAKRVALNTLLNVSGAQQLSSDVELNYLNDDERIGNSARGTAGGYALSRQMFARHLYCTLMLLLDPDYVDPTISTSMDISLNQLRELTARRFAQWAINVVDFRDADPIMTPFEYDMNPLDGWQDTIDGDPSTHDEPLQGFNQRRLVWGCESPHLILTETLAFHDMRLIDSNWDDDEVTGGKKRDEDGDGKSYVDPEDASKSDDDDLDQYRIPQGAFFAELYCPDRYNTVVLTADTKRAPPRELYDFRIPGDPHRPEWRLDLGRVPSARRSDGGVYPVWRLAISVPHVTDASVYARLRDRPDSMTLQPEAIDLFTDEQIAIDRIIWFANVRPTPSTYQYGQIFWNYLGMSPYLGTGQYVVVGPRPKTLMGSAEARTGQGRVQSDNLISLDSGPLPEGNTVRVSPGYPNVGPVLRRSPPPSQIQPAIGIVAGMDPPPDNHPRNPWIQTGETAPFGIGVNISEPLPSGPYYYPEPTRRVERPARFPVVDVYGVENSGPRFPDTPYDHRDGAPLKDLMLLGEGTRQDVRTVFLQRLANPLRPWNPPPGQVDSFGRRLPHDPTLPVNPYITVDWLPVDLTVFNGDDREPSSWTDVDPWNFPQSPRLGEQPREFRFATRQRGDETTRTSPNIYTWLVPEQLPISPEDRDPNRRDYFRHDLIHTLGFLNSTYGLPDTLAPGRYNLGGPRRPFPWLSWNDRPFANNMELLLVPASSASRLLLEFTTDTGENPYGGSDLNNFRAPFRHLLNFFHSTRTPSAAAAKSESANLHRLLELVEVPSRFVGTQRWYNPGIFQRGASQSMDSTNPMFSFQPPFNKLSRFRDPGRININTIYDIRVWQAIAGRFPHRSAAFWSRLIESRRGFPRGDETRFPSEFANPFRSSLGADLDFQLVGLDEPDVEATLLRSDPRDPGSPLFALNSIEPYEDTRRNAYFRYQFLRRLGNIVSTHSNVFAVWITVGYFEVDPGSNTLGQELKLDTGDVARHRAFYIIDRSIPVAFEPGENHNVDRAVLLRRFIE